jgi:hypothetical protein
VGDMIGGLPGGLKRGHACRGMEGVSGMHGVNLSGIEADGMRMKWTR